MKTKLFTLFIAVLLLAEPISAQNDENAQEEPFRTILGNQSTAVGGYISFGMGNTIINDNNSFLGQFRMAARLGHGFSIGLAGSGFTDWMYGLNYDRPGISPNGYYIEGGYGGILIEPVLAPYFPVHISFPLLLGAGGVAFTEDWDDNNWNNFENDTERNVLESDAYFVAEPGVELEFNLARFVRMGAGVSYRFTSAIEVDGRKEHLLNGLNSSISIKLGIF